MQLHCFVNRRRFIGLSVGAGGLAALGWRIIPRGWQRVERTAWALGSAVSLTAYHKDRAVAQSAVAAAFETLDRLEDVLSLYRPHSEICRLNQTGSLDDPHPDMVNVLGSALTWSRLTGGAFDPTVQPLWRLYASGQDPDQTELASACRLIDWRKVKISSSVVRLGPGQAITLNGIAQGYAADKVCAVFRAHGIAHALANTGEFGAVGEKPEGDPWKIGVQHPRIRDAYIALAGLDNRYLATSGDYETKFSDDYSRHHIFDPATGRSPAALSSVTVLAASGLEADALSTAIFVLGPARGLELAASRPGVDALLVLKTGEVLTTPGFPSAS